MGAGIRQPQRPKSTLFIRTVCPLSRLTHAKKFSQTARRIASHAQCFKADGQNFGWGQNFASKERTKNQKCQGAENYLK
jgi:hypothetical protein